MFPVTKLHFLIFILALMASACAPARPTQIAPTQLPDQPSLPNPASVYCEEQGGKVDIRTDAEGNQAGVCVFEDGSECDEWAFYREECQPEEPPSDQTGLPNPASVYCEEQGGKVDIRTGAEGNQAGVCVFENGSECDEWAYFRGECQPGGTESPELPASEPRFIDDAYGFSFDPPSEWSIEEFPNYLLFTRPGYKMFVGFQWANEEAMPFRTGMPQGEFIDGGNATLLGQPLPRQILVWDGKNKVVSYGGRTKMGDLILVMYLDAVEQTGIGYDALDIPQDILAEADQIIASFALTSGETPQLEFNPPSPDN